MTPFPAFAPERRRERTPALSPLPLWQRAWPWRLPTRGRPPPSSRRGSSPAPASRPATTTAPANSSGTMLWFVVGSATNGSDVRVRWMGYNTVDAVSAASVRPPPPLPAGWLESTDEESGFPYYENATTGETTWARPAPPRRPALPKRAVVPHLRAAAAVVGGVRSAAASPYAGAAAAAPRVARAPWSPRRSPWRPSEASLPKRIAGPSRVPRRIRPWPSWAASRRRRTARRSGGRAP